MMLDGARVNTEKKITGKGGVFEAMRSKMWWFKEGAVHNGKPTPEAGQVLCKQQDGASPNAAAADLDHFAREGAKFGFNIKMPPL